MRVTFALCLVTLMACPASAQQRTSSSLPVTVDPATGDYLVGVYDSDLNLVAIVVERADNVLVSVAPSVSADSSHLRYSYTVEVQTDSPHGMDMFQVDCPATSGEVWSLSAHDVTIGDSPYARIGFWAGRSGCIVLLGAVPIAPGGELQVSFTTELLPAIGNARAFASIEGVDWPTPDPIQQNAEARAFVGSVQGFTGGWKEVALIVPARDPATSTDPVAGTQEIVSDLTQACGTLGWISSPAICSAVAADLNDAIAAMSASNSVDAAGELANTLVLLDIERGVSVNEDAYWLLRLNVEHVQKLLES